MSHRPTQARWGPDGNVLGPRWMIARVLQRHPELVSRHCQPVACDVRTRAYLYDVDEAERVLAKVSRWTSARQRT